MFAGGGDVVGGFGAADLYGSESFIASGIEASLGRPAADGYVALARGPVDEAAQYYLHLMRAAWGVQGPAIAGLVNLACGTYEIANHPLPAVLTAEAALAHPTRRPAKPAVM